MGEPTTSAGAGGRAGRGGRLRAAGRALRHRNFRLFFFGQSLSLVGTWMQRLALSWLVYRLTGSALLLGFVGFAGQIPTFLFSPLVGVLADRWNRHRMLVVTQSLAMIQALALAALVLTGAIAVWQIVALAALLGLVNAADIPTRQSFMVEMVEGREDLGNAIALNSSMVNGARLVGPSLAGLLIVVVGEGVCFLLNGLSYLFVIGALLAMRLPERKIGRKRSPVLHDLVEGFRYAFGFAPIRAILFLLAVVSILGVPYRVLLPVFAKDVLGGGAGTLGLLTAATGVGALAGALSLAMRSGVLGLGRWLARAAALLGAGLLALCWSRSIALSLCVMPLVGFGMMVQLASSNTILQTIVDDDKRGRVMSFYAASFLGMAPFGSLLMGFVASRLGAPLALTIGASGCLVGALVFRLRLPSLRAFVRPIYVKKGILPEIATGLESATDALKQP